MVGTTYPNPTPYIGSVKVCYTTPMPLTPAELEKLATLAHLSLTAKEREGLTKDLNAIVGFVDRITKVEEDPSALHLRENPLVVVPDRVEPSLSSVEALDSAPTHTGSAVVAKPLEGTGS